MKTLFIALILLLASCANNGHEEMLLEEIDCVSHKIIDKEIITKDAEVPTTVFTVVEIHDKESLKEDGELYFYVDTVLVKYAVNDFEVKRYIQ